MTPNNMILTLGSSGKGGDGGQWGASAGGNGGGGATNNHYGRNTNPTGNNSGPGAGHGSIGTDPSFNGGTDADAGDGGQGGRAGGLIWLRAQEVICQPLGVKHFITNGGDGMPGERATGKGGIGGDGGKGADGYCSESGGFNIIAPAAGNGLVGPGGNGADGGSGGSAGSHGSIWIGYPSSATQTNVSISHCEQQNGTPGIGKLGGPAGENGTGHKAQTLDLEDCECEGNYGIEQKTRHDACACEENFRRLANMNPAGTDANGNKKWEPSGANPMEQYCIWDAVSKQLICYQKITKSSSIGPTKIMHRYTYCGEFDCSWVNNWWNNRHLGWNTPTVSDHKVDFTPNGDYTFRTGVLTNASGQTCTRDCDPEDEKKNKSKDDPKDGTPGVNGGPAAPQSTAHFYNFVGNVPFPTGTEVAQKTLALYPQPADNQLHYLLNFTPKSSYNIKLLSITGQPIKTWNMEGQSNTLDIQNVPAGSYIIMLTIKGQRFEQRLQISQ